MNRLIMCVVFALFVVYGPVDGVRECYKCSTDDCTTKGTTLDTNIQRPCPHINNICYTVVHPETCKVFEKGCGVPTKCEVYSNCKACESDLCNSEINFTCEDPCKP